MILKLSEMDYVNVGVADHIYSRNPDGTWLDEDSSATLSLEDVAAKLRNNSDGIFFYLDTLETDEQDENIKNLVPHEWCVQNYNGAPYVGGDGELCEWEL